MTLVVIGALRVNPHEWTTIFQEDQIYILEGTFSFINSHRGFRYNDLRLAMKSLSLTWWSL